jgi:RNA polymerase sigma-70 factor (ECF subfamily)
VTPRSQESVAGYVQLFRLGDEKGFNFFYREYYDTLCYYSFQIIKDEQEADGIVGEVFVKLWERPNQFNNLASIRSFLYKATRNASLNWIRKEKNENKKTKDFAYLNQENENTIADKMIELEFYREIFTTLRSLPPNCRKIFEMIYLHGKSFEQISQELNLTESTVRSQKARALMLIRQRINWTIIVFSILFHLS